MRYLLYISVIIFLSSCTREATPEEIDHFIQYHVDQKLHKIRVEKAKDCRRKILEDAQAHIDSIIIEELEIDLLDSIVEVDRPFRAERPAYIRDRDTSKVKPLF